MQPRKVELLTRDELEGRLFHCLRHRQLPDCFLYVDDGADHWLALTASADFDVARRLSDLLAGALPRIVARLPATAAVAGLGVGDGLKERRILEALAGRGRLAYFALDVSSRLVDAAMAAAGGLDVEITGVVAMVEDLPRLRPAWPSPLLLCLLGNNFCNYDAETLLPMVAGQLGPDDRFLFDCHLHPDAGGAGWQRRVERAYGSPRNARFNTWPLRAHGLDESDCRFAIGLVTVATPVGPTVRTHKRIELLRPVRLAFPAGPLALAAGETIAMGCTWKYRPGQVARLLARHRLEIVERFDSPDGENGLFLTRVKPQHS